MIAPNDRVTFAVRYEDEAVAVVEKPPGLVTTPGKGHDDDSLLNGLFARFGKQLRQLGAARDHGLLQRLDREASGLLVVALTPASWDVLREQFAKRTIRKYYWAVARRAPNQPSGVIRKPLEEFIAQREDIWIEDPRRRKFAKIKLAKVSARGKPAMTAYRTLASSQSGATIECRTLTGRLHQVRVHLDSIGCSILGDRFYGPVASRRATTRLSLHAHRIVTDHPATGERLDVRTKCPRDLRRAATRLGLPPPGVFSADGPPAETETSASSSAER
ncbi:MAG: RluA family pseudouridine synthase [Planctomycetota bacterium]